MNIKNVAIIAHVDHGKTTLVNKLIEAGSISHHQLVDRAMDSDDLEREKGITILAKATSINYNGNKINILDTPGHADFGGEVERIMHMVDGVLLLVDAFEGVMPQTRFVLEIALNLGVKPIVVVNKIDRDSSDPNNALNEVYDLFIDLGADLEELEFPVIYGSALLGKMSLEPKLEETGMEVILEEIVKHIPSPKINSGNDFIFQPSLIDYNSYVGRMGVGKIYSGTVKEGETIFALRNDGSTTSFRVQKIYQNVGLEKVEVKEAHAGDIVSIAGLSDINVGETITNNRDTTRLPAITISEPTVEMTFSANDSPFKGLEGDNVTANKIESRLMEETRRDVSLRVTKGLEKESFIVAGRGELHLSILIENMRREGFEFLVSKPKVIIKEENGVRLEPYEEVYLDVPTEFSGKVIESLSKRGGELLSINDSNNYSKIKYIMPSRGLIGYMTHFLTLTKGYGVINHSFFEFKEVTENIQTERISGALIAIEDGHATEYALKRLEDRGLLFVKPRTKVYEGMVVGENNKQGDLVVNVTTLRQLTNIRQANKDQTVVLKVPKIMSLEESLSFINNDELVEVTPNNIRIRKKYLKEHERKRDAKNNKTH